MASPVLLSGYRFSSAGPVSASSLGTTVTAHASSNTKGSYTELISATAHAASGILLQFGVSSNGEFLIDIAIGAASSEQIIIPDIPYHTQAAAHDVGPVFIPLSIPAGVRLSARCQSSVGNNVTRIIVSLVGGGPLSPGSFSSVTSYGVNTADSGGVSVDPGGTINTKGSYSEITAATTAQLNYLVICIGGQGNASRSAFQWLLDIAIGAAASEQIIIPDLMLISSTAGDMMYPRYYGFPFSIPAGTRIAARAQCSGNDASDRPFDVSVLGVG